jgi:hypothetical protein
MTADKKYNKIYFLHIPKSGGRYLNEIAVYPIARDLSRHGISWINTTDHDGWINDIDQDTYVISILRDPVKLACSYFSFFYVLQNMLELDLKNNETLQNLKVLFLDFLKKNVWLHNFQSKFLTTNCANMPIKKALDFSIINESLLHERLNNVSFLLTQDYLESNPLEVAMRVFNDINVYPHTIGIPVTDQFRQEPSKLLYDSLSQEEKELIALYFESDYKIYNLARSREIANSKTIPKPH